MIWIIFTVFMVVETTIHALIINRGIDPTPDHKKWGSLIAIIARLGYWVLLWWGLGGGGWLLLSLYALGSLFLHLLVFPVLLNWMTGKEANHLGNGTTDKILALVPPIARWFWLLCLATGMIYGYFNPDLL